MPETVESELVDDRTLRMGFENVTIVAGIGEYSCPAIGCIKLRVAQCARWTSSYNA